MSGDRFTRKSGKFTFGGHLVFKDGHQLTFFSSFFPCSIFGDNALVDNHHNFNTHAWP